MTPALPARRSPGADGRNRTDNLSLTKGLLYQLSYIGRMDKISRNISKTITEP